MISLILIALILCNNTSTHMSLHWDTLSWFRVIQSLILFINPASLVKKQKYKLNSRWFDLTWTRTHYLQDSRWACYLLHHLTWPGLEPTIYKTQGEHAIHYITWPDLDSNPLSTRLQGEHAIHYITWPNLDSNPLSTGLQGEHAIHHLTWTLTHYLQDSRWACYSLHHLTWPGLEPTIYKTQGEHAIHYITWPDLTWTLTHYLQDWRWACYPLHHQCR